METSLDAGPAKGAAAAEVQMKSRSKGVGEKPVPKPLADGIKGRKGSGKPLSETRKSAFESRFNQDFSDVRIHDDPASHELASSIGAHAFTHQNDIIFDRGQFNENSAAGQKLLSHELTHVVQQRNGTSDQIQRQDNEENTEITVGASRTVAGRYQSGDVQLEPGDTVIVTKEPVFGFVEVQLPAPYAQAYQPIVVPLSVIGAQGGDPSGIDLAMHPGGLGEMIDIGPASMLEGLQEGVVTEIDPSQLPTSVLASVAQQSNDPDSFGWLTGMSMVQTGNAINRTANQHLMTYGFNRTLDNSIGLVGYPNTTPMAALRRGNMPQSPIMFGHTIATVRMDGRVVAMTSFGPRSLLGAGIDAYSGSNTGVSGHIIQHLDDQPFPLNISGTHGYPNTGAVSIEYPVSAEQAQRMARHLQGQQADDMLRYAAYMEQCQGGRNCVAWALDQIEPELGGPVGSANPDGTTSPLYHQAGEGTARQGKFQQTAANALEHQSTGGTRGAPVADVPNAGTPHVDRMPMKLRVVKWGGRILVVGGFVYSGYRIASAEEEQRDMVIQEEALTQGAGLIGGPVGGLVADAYGVPLVQMAHGEVDETLLILPHPFLLPVVRYLEPAKQDPEGARLIRRAVLDNDPASCMSVMSRMFGVPMNWSY